MSGQRRNEMGMSNVELEEHVMRLGGRRALARAIGVDAAAVRAWLSGKRVMKPRTAARIRQQASQAPASLGRPNNPALMSTEEFDQCIRLLGGVRATARALNASVGSISAYRSGARNAPIATVEAVQGLVAGIERRTA
jgi:DNA-binding transcriptional regulator YdaS (Cro superfamily)